MKHSAAAQVLPAYGWQRCLRLSNDRVEVLASLEVGPRLLHWGPAGGENLLHVEAATAGLRGGGRWRIYGGHRLLSAPERQPFAPDNAPVDWEALPSGVRLRQAPERGTGLLKEWDLTLDPRRPRLRLLHRFRNPGPRPRRLAAWALTVLKPGGEVLLPLPERGRFPAKVRAAGALVLWPYTDLADRRWRFGPGLIRYHADPKARAPQKLGLFSGQGWLAYRRRGLLLTIQSRPRPGLPHADFGSNAEVWGRHDMVELETLGPLVDLAPGKALEHEEIWTLGRLKPGAMTDAALGAAIRRQTGLLSRSH